MRHRRWAARVSSRMKFYHRRYMPAMSGSRQINMTDEAWNDRRMWRLAVPASLILHLLIAAALIFGLSESPPPRQEDEAISVELVPAPQPPRNDNIQPYPVLQRVFQFGEKDAGSVVSPDGNSANADSGSPEAVQDPEKRDDARPSAATTARAEEVPQLRTQQAPALAPEDVAKAQSRLRPAKTLFSQRATGSATATIAMGYVPRDMRVARLCASELTEQLRHASPSYPAEIVPFERLKEGTIVENYGAVFRSNWAWYGLSYRCEVDTDATKVVSFALDIGTRLTPEEWRRKGCPPNNC